MLVPLITVIIAFVVAGLVMLITGSNPLKIYGAIFDGTGLNWLFPWVTGQARTIAALDLQQTLVATAPLILTGLCGRVRVQGRALQHRRARGNTRSARSSLCGSPPRSPT